MGKKRALREENTEQTRKIGKSASRKEPLPKILDFLFFSFPTLSHFIFSLHHFFRSHSSLSSLSLPSSSSPFLSLSLPLLSFSPPPTYSFLSSRLITPLLRYPLSVSISVHHQLFSTCNVHPLFSQPLLGKSLLLSCVAYIIGPLCPS